MIRYFYYPDLALTFAVDTDSLRQYWYCADSKMGVEDVNDNRRWTLVGENCPLEKILSNESIEEIDRLTLMIEFDIPPLESAIGEV
jgi:hypothetical protein